MRTISNARYMYSVHVADAWPDLPVPRSGGCASKISEDERQDAGTTVGVSREEEAKAKAEGAVANEADAIGLGLAPRLAQRLAFAQKTADEGQHRAHVAGELVVTCVVVCLPCRHHLFVLKQRSFHRAYYRATELALNSVA